MRCSTPSTFTLFFKSTSVTVPLFQQEMQGASDGFTHTSSPTVIFTCSCSTPSVTAHECCHSYLKTDQCGTNVSSCPVFGAMLYQETASWGEIRPFSVSFYCSMVPLHNLIATRPVCGSEVLPDTPPRKEFSKNFQKEGDTSVHKNFFHWPPLQKHHLNNPLYLSWSLF